MLASPTTSFRLGTRDSSMSPSCRAHHSTPSKPTSNHHHPSYDSPMLTPSPFRQRPRSPNHTTAVSTEADDFFLQSPFRSPSPARRFHPSYTTKPQPISMDDDEGAIFLASKSAAHFSPVFFPDSSSQPLLTPIKRVHRVPSRPVLSIKHLNTVPHVAAAAAPHGSVNQSSRVGVGTKRKSTPLATTPLRNRVLTPLSISTTKNVDPVTGVAFDRLAPLPAPRFTAVPTQSKAEMDVHLQRETNTMIKLRITDLDQSDDEFGAENGDSACEKGGDDDTGGDVLFGGRLKAKSLGRELLADNGKVKEEEVAEAVSPGGHITKRRARSRPVSLELFESVNHSPLPDSSHNEPKSSGRNGNSAIIFPTASRARPRVSSPASSSETGSPLPRRRVSGGLRPQHPKQSQIHSAPLPGRAPLNRLESASSATLFFGPAIPTTSNKVRTRISTTSSSSVAAAATSTVGSRRARPTAVNRHSYAGQGCESLSALPWNMIQVRSASPSPRSSPLSLPQRDTPERSDDLDDEDMFFGAGPQDSSFVFNVTKGTPSPRSKKAAQAGLPMKYKPRDSGIMLSDDEEMSGNLSGDFLSVMPAASMSVGSIYSDGEDGLVTPGAGPGVGSGWPEADVMVGGNDDIGENSFGGGDSGVNAFILRTLAAGTKGQQDGPKKVPGTPVKKVKTSRLIVDRPWQSAVAAKVGLGFDAGGKKAKEFAAPRKSLPAAFPALGRKASKVDLNATDSEGEGEDVSPSWRKDKYVGIGFGRPPNAKENVHVLPRTRWLMRRSSSGAFSSGSDVSMAGTPTRRNGKDWNLPPPRLSTEFSPSDNAIKLSPGRSTSSSSSSSVMLNSPSLHPTARRLPPLPISGGQRRPPVNTIPTSDTRRLSEPSAQDQPGRFTRDFLEVDEVGSGEFGKVIKVRCKDGREGELFAVKKSKRFEGARHRLRLREEVDILQHLSQIAASTGWPQARHPNVLAYIDSWEQEEALYIRTELCELGNFARFLWEYGRAFPRLDEARVWKIIVDLSNGLRFIHDSGVIHLDLKPANIFVTSEGRFKIGDFGMASLWPRPRPTETRAGAFEREGDKLYLAPEVLQGEYGKAADIFSLGVTILETASNIVVPDQGEPWHRLRQEDFGQVDLDESPELLELIKSMMRTNPSLRVDIHDISAHPIVCRTRVAVERMYDEAKSDGSSVFVASPLAGVPDGFLEDILGGRVRDEGAMDVCP